jgi:hypothetical protein
MLTKTECVVSAVVSLRTPPPLLHGVSVNPRPYGLDFRIFGLACRVFGLDCLICGLDCIVCGVDCLIRGLDCLMCTECLILTDSYVSLTVLCHKTEPTSQVGYDLDPVRTKQVGLNGEWDPTSEDVAGLDCLICDMTLTVLYVASTVLCAPSWLDSVHL